MTTYEYMSLKEIFSVKAHLSEQAEWLRQIIEIHPDMKNITLFDAKEYFMNSAANLETEIRTILNIKNESKI